VPLPIQLQPDQQVDIKVWFRGDKIGKHDFRFLFMYQSEDETKGAYRAARYRWSTLVNPSLKLNAFTRPSLSDFGDYILGLEVC
jgi:hypothetical protein